MQKSNLNIINLSDLSADWHWLRDEFKHLPNKWAHYTSLNTKLPKHLPKRQSIARFMTATQAVLDAKKQPSLLVSHGPRPAYYGARMAQHLHPQLPHLAYSFNFTDLPTGFQHKAMAKAYQQIDRFVVYSSLEKKLYADYFGIALERIDMLHWSVHAPTVPHDEPPIEQGDYICALGSQGRDYETLFAAMRTLRHIRLVVVATADSVQHLSVPENVTIRTHIPLAHAHNILTHSRLMVVPLRDSQVPCGHVTIASGMFFNKAMIVTNSEGVHDYIQDQKTGVFFNPKEANDLAEKIQQLWDDPIQINRLAATGYAFALEHCTEKNVVRYFADYLSHLQHL
ncbi:glycosyltransferase [Methylophilaceae bacterium 11]|nr:glycosyltransferase [Methylophilaceae bacterium 11]